MAGCLKNEFIKLKSKLLPFAVLTLVLAGIMVLHLCVDVRTEFAENLQLYKNGEEAYVSSEKLIQRMEQRISERRKSAAALRKQGKNDEADALDRRADLEEKECLNYYRDLAGRGVADGSWQYDCVDSRYSALARGENALAEGFEKALKENDSKTYLQNMCESLREPNDELELRRYYRYSFLLETGCDIDKTANVSRASQYAHNMALIDGGAREEEAETLKTENEWLKAAARNNAGEPEKNVSFFYVASQSVLTVQLPLTGMLGVFAAAAVFGPDRKRKKVPAIYLLPAGRIKTNVSKLVTAAILSIGGLVLYSAICLVPILILGKDSMFEAVFAVVLGNAGFCTPIAIYLLMILALIPAPVLVISFTFFAVAITRNTPVSVALGMVFAISLLVCRIVEMIHPVARYWLRYTAVSVADWTPFVVAVDTAAGQSFLWTAVFFALHGAFFAALGLVLEKYSED